MNRLRQVYEKYLCPESRHDVRVMCDKLWEAVVEHCAVLDVQL